MGGQISSDMLRGHTDTIVLASLLDRDRYGFEIYNRVLQKTNHLYELKETTLYSSYKRLEKEGYIESYWGDETQGGRRKYYHITERGGNYTGKNSRIMSLPRRSWNDYLWRYKLWN